MRFYISVRLTVSLPVPHTRLVYHSPSFYPPACPPSPPSLPKGQTINMTAPVTMMEEPLDGDANRYQMCFYIPAAHQLEPPKPTDPNVYIEVRPRLTVAAR